MSTQHAAPKGVAKGVTDRPQAKKLRPSLQYDDVSLRLPVPSLGIATRWYYKRQFPYKLLHKWLTCGAAMAPGLDFGNREFALTLPSGAMVRNLHFSTTEEWQACVNKCSPVKMDAGGMQSTRTNSHGDVEATSEMKFDIDASDYDYVRSWMSPGETGATLTQRCWVFMVAAVKVVDSILRDEFGFKHILWVYSGRRGVHAWVSDARARALFNKARVGIVSYLSMFNDGFSNPACVEWPLHPCVGKRLPMLTNLFVQHFVLCNVDGDAGVGDAEAGVDATGDAEAGVDATDAASQSLLAPCIGEASARWTLVLRHVPTARRLRENVEAEWRRCRAPLDRWNALVRMVEQHVVARIVVTFLWPRLDTHVSTSVDHLLKLPFCVHPSTPDGTISVPFDARHVDRFRIALVPTAKALLQACSNTGEGSADVASELAPFERVLDDAISGCSDTPIHDAT